MSEKLDCSYSTISPQQLMAKVIPDYCIDNPLECLFWQRGANDTYQIRCADTCYFLRVYRCGAFPREANEFEAEALTYLHQQGFPVAQPIARKSGGYITEIAAQEGPRFVLVNSLAEGVIPDYASLETCRTVGESIAQLHLSSNGFKTLHKRTGLDLQGLLENSMVNISKHMAHRPDAMSIIRKIAEDTQAKVLAAPENSLDVGLCHGDLHGGNLHIHKGIGWL